MVKISLSALAFALGLLAFAFLSFTNSAHARTIPLPYEDMPDDWKAAFPSNPFGGKGGGAIGGAGVGGDWNDDIPPPSPILCYKVSNYYFGRTMLEACHASDPSYVLHKSDSTNFCKNPSTGSMWAIDPADANRCDHLPEKDTTCPIGYYHDGSDCVKKFTCPAGTKLEGKKCVFIDKPLFPDPVPPPPPENPDEPCNVCMQIYHIQLKLNALHNYDLNIINSNIINMYTDIMNIENNISNLELNMIATNNYLTQIDNSMGDLITNIENNNITQNEIKNEVNNITNKMNDYSLQLGDIRLALGDIDLSLKNTNKLVLDLGLDIDFIKNNLVNGGSDNKDYTAQLNTIIDLLKPCEPTDEKPCPSDDDVLKKLKEIQDFMVADFLAEEEMTQVDVEDLTDIQLDRNLINFGSAQCPPDNTFSTMVNGFSFSGGFKHKPLCDFFTLLAPFVKAFGGFSAVLILGGGLRRG